MPFVFLDMFCIQLWLTFTVFLLKMSCSLWDLKMSIDQSKKYLCSICGYCFAEWWFKPNNISRSIFWFLSLIFGVFKTNFEPNFLQSNFVFTFCCVEYLLIGWVFPQSLLYGIRNLLYDVWWVVWLTMNLKKPIVWLFVRSISSISQIKWNVQKIYFFELSFNLEAKTSIFKYSDDVFSNFVSFLSIKIS